jgi:hypothetical protein
MSGRARLGRYALWQAFDFLVERAAAIAIILGVYLYLSHLAVGSSPKTPGGAVPTAMLRALAPLLMKNMLGMTWIMVGLLAANGISSNDRTTGRFRFLFSKPLRIDVFYAQAFTINVVLASACLLSSVILLARWTLAPAAFVHDALIVAASGVIGISGLCFFFSALWRFDWVATVGVWGAVNILYIKYPGAAWLRFLPPTNVVGDQIDLLGASLPIEVRPLLWFVAFGLLCFTAGLVILRRRPLST